MKKLFLYFLLASAGILASCSSDPTPNPDPDPDAAKVEIVVSSEGGYNRGLATLSAIYDDGAVSADIFQSVNTRPLGDMAQTISYIDGNYYVCLTGKIEVMEPQTFKQVKTLTLDDGSGSTVMPRYVVKTGTNEAVASTSAGLIRINTQTLAVTQYITPAALPGRPEYLAVAGGKLFCGVWKEEWPGTGEVGVAVFDLANLAGGYRLLTEVPVGENSKTCKIIVDKNNKVWVVSHRAGISMTLSCLDPATETVTKTIAIPFIDAGPGAIGKVTGAPSYPRIDTDRTKGKLYLTLHCGTATSDQLAVYSVDVDGTAISTEPYRRLPDVDMLYGMAVSPDGQTVYVCDALDYTAQRGYLREYGAGENVVSYRTGIYPSWVHFTEYDR